MAIGYRGAGNFDGSGSGITLTMPSGTTAGDFLLMVLENANQDFNSPISTGWTEAPGSPVSRGTANAATGVRLSVHYKIAGSSEGSVNVGDTGNHQTGQIFGFTGVETGDPFDIYEVSTGAVSTTATFPGVTTTVPNAWIVHCCAIDTDANSSANMGAATNANLSSITERGDQAVNIQAGGGIVVITGIKETAGATGNTTANGSSNIGRTFLTLALKPATTKAAGTVNADSTAQGHAPFSVGTSDGTSTAVGKSPSLFAQIQTSTAYANPATAALYDTAAGAILVGLAFSTADSTVGLTDPYGWTLVNETSNYVSFPVRHSKLFVKKSTGGLQELSFGFEYDFVYNSGGISIVVVVEMNTIIDGDIVIDASDIDNTDIFFSNCVSIASSSFNALCVGLGTHSLPSWSSTLAEKIETELTIQAAEIRTGNASITINQGDV